MEWCSKTLATFRTTRNHCRRVLENAKCLYAQAFQSQIESKQLESREFRKISNQILNRSKTSVSTIKNCHRVISFSLDKAKAFTMFCASMLDEEVNLFPDFSYFTEHIYDSPRNLKTYKKS